MNLETLKYDQKCRVHILIFNFLTGDDPSDASVA